MNSKRMLIVDLVCVALLIAFGLAIALPRWRVGIDWGDEGFLAYSTVRVMNGQIPNRDFVSLQPPLSFYTVAAIFKTFGTSLASLRILGLSIYLLIPLLIYGIGRSLTRPLPSFASAVPAIVLGLPSFDFVPFAVWQGITASLAAVLLIIHATIRKRRWLALPAGIVTAASLILRHDQAAYAILSICALFPLLTVVRHDLHLHRALVLWLVGIAVVLIPLILIWWRIGALPEMIRQLVLFPFATYRKTSSLPFPKLAIQNSLSETVSVLLFYLPPFAQAIAAVYLIQSAVRRRFQSREAILAFFTIWSALFYCQVWTRSDLGHLFVTLPPFFLLLTFGWLTLLKKIRAPAKIDIVLSVVGAMVAVWFLWVLSAISVPRIPETTELLTLPRGGVRIEERPIVEDFVTRLQEQVPPSRSILVLPYQPMFYFLCDRRNPTRWNYLWPGDQTTQEHERLIQEAESDPPAVVLLLRENEIASFAPVIVGYVHAHYIQTGGDSDLTTYARRDP